MKKKRILPAALLVLSLLIFAGCANNAEPPADDSGPAQTQNMALWSADINTTTLAGEAVTQEDFQDNTLTVMNFWATWCSPCVRELPELEEVSEYYKDQGVEIVGVLHDGVTLDLERDEEKIEQAKTLLADAGADYRVIVPDETIDLHFEHQLMSFPTTFFLDADGNVVRVALRAYTADDWKVIIDEVLAQIS